MTDSVWLTAQTSAPAQRADRYLPGSAAHPAKMLPAIAAQAITRYTKPGDYVLDPMRGIGTTLIEAVHAARHALGTEYEPHWAQIARRNLAVLAQALDGFGHVVAWRPPPAGLLAFLPLSGGRRSDDFARRLLDQTGILVVPSTVYASPHAPVPDNYIRLGFGRGHVAEAAGVFAAWLSKVWD